MRRRTCGVYCRAVKPADPSRPVSRSARNAEWAAESAGGPAHTWAQQTSVCLPWRHRELLPSLASQTVTAESRRAPPNTVTEEPHLAHHHASSAEHHSGVSTTSGRHAYGFERLDPRGVRHPSRTRRRPEVTRTGQRSEAAVTVLAESPARVSLTSHPAAALLCPLPSLVPEKPVWRRRRRARDAPGH